MLSFFGDDIQHHMAIDSISSGCDVASFRKLLISVTETDRISDQLINGPSCRDARKVLKIRFGFFMIMVCSTYF